MSISTEAQLFGSYRVLPGPDGRPALLGRGAFGTVMCGRDETTGREVALKIIHDHLAADPRVRRRFRDEAREHRRLKHNGVVQVLDVGDTESTLYIVMEYCSGGDLQTWSAKRGPLEPAPALRLLRPIADTLVYASGHGLIHRDIKPSNILLVEPAQGDALPEVKLADFGLAKKVWDDHRRDGDGTTVSMASHAGIKGTLQFASPEQVREEKIDARCDMFSFGLTLWHLLAGRYPFPELTQDYQFIRERAELVSYEPLFPAEWPPALRGLMARLVAAKPEDRFENFGHVVSAMDDCLEEWESMATTSSSDAPAPPAAPLRTAHLPVREFFSLNFLENTPIGALFDASPLAAEEDGPPPHRQLTLLSQDLSPEWRAEIRESIRRLAAHPHPSLVTVEWRETRDGDAVIVDLPPDAPLLLDRLRTAPLKSFRDSLAWLEQAAGALDHAAHLGLPGVETAPGAISLLPDDKPDRPRLVLPAKLYHTDPQGAAPSSTLTMLSVSSGASGGPKTPATAFSLLAYRMLSGRDPKQASLATPSAYVSIDALSESGNALLRDALCDHIRPTCAELLTELRRVEGLGSRQGGSTVGGSTATRHSTLPPQPMAPVPSSVGKSVAPVIRPLSQGAAPPPSVVLSPASIPPAPPAPPPAAPTITLPESSGSIASLPSWLKWAAIVLPLVLIAGISGLFLLWRKAPSPSPTPTLPPVVAVEPSEPPPPMALPDPPKPSVVSVTNEPARSPTPLPDVVVPPTSFFTIGSLRYKPQDLLSEGNLDLIAPTLLNGSVERASGSEGEFYFCLPTANSILPPLAMAAMSKWIEVNGGGAAVQGRLEALDRQASENERIALKDCLRQWTMLAPTVQSTTDRSHAFERHVRLMQEYYRYAQRSHPQELWAHLYSFHDKFQHSSLLLLTWDVLKQCQDRPEMARHALQYLESLVDSKSRQSTAITDDQRQFRRILTGKRTAATAAGVTVFSIQETSPTGVVKNLWSVTTRPPSRGGEWDAWLSVAGELPKPKLSGTLGATVELDLASCRTYNRTGEIRLSPDGHAAH